MLSALFMIVLKISAASGIIILALIAFSSRLNKIFTSKWKFWVWLLASVRLLLPVNLTIPQAPIRLSVSDIPVLTSPQRQISHMPLYPFASHTLTFVELAAFIWIAGMFLFLLYHLIVYRTCKRKVFRWCRATKDERLLSALNDMRLAAGVRKDINLLISPAISGPMIVGFFNCRLLLPTEDYAEPELYYIIKHELIHIKRRDIWYKLLLLCANAVHWFNPVMYLMLHEAGKDLELACDEEVVKGLASADRKEYSDTILRSIRRNCFKGTALTVCLHGGTAAMKARFSNILSKDEKRAGIFPGVTAVLCIFLAGALIVCDSSGLAENFGDYTGLEYYYITSDLREFPVDDIFISVSASGKEDVKTTASRHIEYVAAMNNFALPNYFDQYFFIRKLKDENELERLKEHGLADSRSQLHTLSE